MSEKGGNVLPLLVSLCAGHLPPAAQSVHGLVHRFNAAVERGEAPVLVQVTVQRGLLPGLGGVVRVSGAAVLIRRAACRRRGVGAAPLLRECAARRGGRPAVEPAPGQPRPRRLDDVDSHELRTRPGGGTRRRAGHGVLLMGAVR